MKGRNDFGFFEESMSADCIAKWLHANGLATAGELKTISLNICMAARHNLTPAVIKNGQYTPAEGSAVERLARKLTELNVTGIKVTGSNDVVDAKEKTGYTRTPISGLLAKNAQAFRQMSIPIGFAFDRTTLKMTVPEGWVISQKSIEDSRLCQVKAPDNWTVTRKQARRKTTQYDGSQKEVFLASGDYTFTDPVSRRAIAILNDGWIVTEASREALAAEGWHFIDNRNMQFVGTGGALVLESEGETLRILERLAKSGAKAVAYS